MKKLIFILLLPLFLLGQEVRIYDAYNLFSDTETISKTSGGIAYFTMLNADTATSKLIVIDGGRNGDVRVSVVMDTVVDGTADVLSATVYAGLKIGEFGSDVLDYKWVSLGTISSTDNNTTQTYILTDLADWAGPVQGYKVRIITTGTQKDNVYVNVLQYYPNK